MSDGREGKRPRLFRMPTSRGRLRGDIDRELHFHIEGRIEELTASGLTREQAEREVAQRFGDMAAVRDQLEEIDTRTHRRHEFGEWRGALARDFGQALRGILLRPAFAAVVVLTLGLGIGATTAIYALLDAVVLRPLPYPNASRLVYIEQHDLLTSAIQREKNSKKYPRKWKLNLIEGVNPNWDDLSSWLLDVPAR